jgi:type II restriction/modification system DNA methylase subunit YeeA
VVWIGSLQWMTANGFPVSNDPVLEPIDTIRLQDALLDLSDPEQPREAEWPEADVNVGNPPFLGGKRMRVELSDGYVDALFAVYSSRVAREADLVCYFFEKARGQIAAARLKRARLLATNSIRGDANRRVLERIKQSGNIFVAWSDEPWILEGAAGRISIVGFDDGSETRRILDGREVSAITPDLTGSIDVSVAQQLPENRSVAFMGVTPGGPFDLPGSEARTMLAAPVNPNGRLNADVVRPYFNGIDLTRRPRDVWIIDFGTHMPIEAAALYELPFQHVLEHMKPQREKSRTTRSEWWIHERPRVEMRAALAPLPRYIGTSMVAKHRFYCWLDRTVLPANLLIVFARDDDYFFGVLHARARGLVAAHGHLARCRQRPALHADDLLRDVPLPAPDRRAARGHRRSGGRAGPAAPALAQPSGRE